mmetsp:Transcript_9468/g.27191  ORF Transcript_9468/g.27191 Transcript_9468/m.27191 type:complete len:118 (-) Transcript_9468:87-440(-)
MVWTPIHTAAREGDSKRLNRCLGVSWLQKIDINSPSKNWMFMLIQIGLDFFRLPANSGHTALHMTAANGHLEAMQIILNQKGVDKNARTIQGNTPLHLACLNSREKACVLLVRWNIF